MHFEWHKQVPPQECREMYLEEADGAAFKAVEDISDPWVPSLVWVYRVSEVCPDARFVSLSRISIIEIDNGE